MSEYGLLQELYIYRALFSEQIISVMLCKHQYDLNLWMSTHWYHYNLLSWQKSPYTAICCSQGIQLGKYVAGNVHRACSRDQENWRYGASGHTGARTPDHMYRTDQWLSHYVQGLHRHSWYYPESAIPGTNFVCGRCNVPINVNHVQPCPGWPKEFWQRNVFVRILTLPWTFNIKISRKDLYFYHVISECQKLVRISCMVRDPCQNPEDVLGVPPMIHFDRYIRPNIIETNDPAVVWLSQSPLSYQFLCE